MAQRVALGAPPARPVAARVRVGCRPPPPCRASAAQEPPPPRGRVARFPAAAPPREPAPPAPPAKPPPAPPVAAAAESVRVNKCFRAFASRREADRYVEEGRVLLNGATAGAGDRVRPGDVVTLDGRVIAWQTLQAELLPPTPSASSPSSPSSPAGSDAGDDVPLPLESRFSYLLYWKPRGIVSTSDTRVAGNLTAAMAAAGVREARMFSVGRLDKDSTGALLLTNDGRLPNAVLRAATHHEKLYRVTANVPVTDAHVAQLAAGVVITTLAQRDGTVKPLTARTLPCDVRRDERPDGRPVRGADGRTLLITLREGRNRQIRKMLSALGYDTLLLHRLRFMHIGLGDLRPGEWRVLTEAEMRGVRAAVRAAGAAAAAAPPQQEWDAAREAEESE
jgi:23S rRNA pseudouridine2604 synthase